MRQGRWNPSTPLAQESSNRSALSGVGPWASTLSNWSSTPMTTSHKRGMTTTPKQLRCLS